ncbi:hypothetical protein E5676_scaffold142G003790 [Cucumis melo var. makuwa]|uniref:Uncharacterized protein n=1 Tax=Cucumis melo var. makuwa TaxID=1194695 RepID=A0A5D3DIX1_CUCMM|nr:hypothetical protein E6C27_scaffold178G00070 [Cucumis melo var. makuwa]TYK23320.1 hypothetical protein E5676_scaffold142G003790 [Cucumis melo var. makuwa]
MTPPSAIQLLMGDDRAFVVRSIILIHRLGRDDRAPSLFREVPSSTFIIWRGDNVVSDPTSTGGRSGFCVRSIVLELSDTFAVWKGDSTVNDPTFTKGRSGFFCQIHCPGRSDQAHSSFGVVTMSSAIQLILGEDRAFAVRSTVLVEAIGHLRRLERWPCRQRSNLYWGTIRLLPSDPSLWLERSDTFVV